jgi:hypothetical protein
MNILPDPEIAHSDMPRSGCVSVYETHALISDKPAINALLEPIPDAKLLRPKLQRDCTAHHWDPEQQIDYWVFSNGRNIVRLSIEGLDEQEVARSRALFAERCRRFGHGRIAWIEGVLREATNSPTKTMH